MHVVGAPLMMRWTRLLQSTRRSRRSLVSPVSPIYPVDEDIALPGLVDVKSAVSDVVVDLKYRGAENFLGRDVYGGLRRAFLHPAAAVKLVTARQVLAQRAPDLTFLVWDAARPVRAQRILFAHVKGTSEEKYVADPDGRVGSIHSYGCALDLGLVRSATRDVVDMGTIYDHFGREAEPREELALLKEGVLSSEQLANRLLLREVMLRAGFTPIAYEWWHFNAFDNDTVAARFEKIP
jgi:D-alanyl-D-alanine dipeptidase